MEESQNTKNKFERITFTFDFRVNLHRITPSLHFIYLLKNLSTSGIRRGSGFKIKSQK